MRDVSRLATESKTFTLRAGESFRLSGEASFRAFRPVGDEKIHKSALRAQLLELQTSGTSLVLTQLCCGGCEAEERGFISEDENLMARFDRENHLTELLVNQAALKPSPLTGGTTDCYCLELEQLENEHKELFASRLARHISSSTSACSWR